MLLISGNKQTSKTLVDTNIDVALLLILQSGETPLIQLPFLTEEEHNLNISSSNPQGEFYELAARA